MTMNYDFTHCTLCPRRCGADRNAGNGKCGCRVLPKVARAALHFGEEPCISGKEGSGAVFFSGCPLGCVFCQNLTISHENRGREITPQRLSDIFRELEEQGANNLNLVTPTQWSVQIMEALDIYRPHIPVIYNCGGYERVETLKMLEQYVDVYLPDLKYADPQLSKAFSGAEDYPETAFSAVREMLRQKGNPVLDERGMIKSGVIIRHLVLPLHVKNTFRVIDRVKREFGTETWMSLMFQFTPVYPVKEFPELNRSLTARERKRAEDYIEKAGFLNGYVQEPDSKGTSFIPVFDLTGV